MDHDHWMREALSLAAQSAAQGEIPIGAVLVRQGTLLASSHNAREASKNPLHHAEILVLEEASKILGDWRFTDTALYVTLEPCPMCLGALLQARVGQLVFGCLDPKRKPVDFERRAASPFSFPNLSEITSVQGNNHVLAVTGPVLEPDCSRILKDFFKARREATP